MYILFLIISVVLVLTAFLMLGNTTQTLSTAIAIIALLISLVSAFKHSIFPFRLRVLSNAVVVVSPRPNLEGYISFILPLHFINEGYGESVVEYVTVDLENESGDKKRLIPVAEVPIDVFLESLGKVDESTIKSGFWGFPLHEKEVVEKSILFGEPNKPDNPLSLLSKPGDFKFTVKVKLADKVSFVNKASFVRTIKEKDIDMLNSGKSILLMAVDPMLNKGTASA